jgi:hypothetical protein
VIGLPIAVLLFLFIPKPQPKSGRPPRAVPWWKDAATAMKTVFSTRSRCSAGFISGLFFIPTTIFDMVWGVRFLERRTTSPTRWRCCARPRCRSGGSSAARCSAG